MKSRCARPALICFALAVDPLPTYSLPLPVSICPFFPLFYSSFPLTILYFFLPSASEPRDTTDSPLIRISPTCSMALNENGISIRSIGARPRRFKGARMETAREAVNLESAETSGPTSRRTVSSIVPSAGLLAIVQSTSTTLIGFINTIKRGELWPRNRVTVLEATDLWGSLRSVILVFPFVIDEDLHLGKVELEFLPLSIELSALQLIYEGYYINSLMNIFVYPFKGVMMHPCLYFRVYLFCYWKCQSLGNT